MNSGATADSPVSREEFAKMRPWKRARTEVKPSSVIIQFQSVEGESTGPKIEVPVSSSQGNLEELLNTLQEVRRSEVRNNALKNTERVPYAFFVGEEEILGSVEDICSLSSEAVLPVTFEPLAVFRVKPVTRCTDSMPGHTEAVLHVSFSPNGKVLASGGGDASVRFWDVFTCTPTHVCSGHADHILYTAWSPNGKHFASGDRKGAIIVWNPATGKQVGKTLTRHRLYVTSLSWEPMHCNSACVRLASASKDATVRVWNVKKSSMEFSLQGHAGPVESVKWGGEGYIYSASRDRTIRVWSVAEKKLVYSLTGHASRVNSLALSYDHLYRLGCHDHTGIAPGSDEEGAKASLQRWEAARKAGGPERLVSCSDDFTLFLWEPTESKKAVARMAGHQQAVNHILFSPDGRYIASGSFDKKIRLWHGRTGKFIATLSSHIAAVYQIAWSADSRLLASASKDSTVKVWAVAAPKKPLSTLPGHFDEVYALDWSPDGERVASGSKDRLVKMYVFPLRRR